MDLHDILRYQIISHDKTLMHTCIRVNRLHARICTCVHTCMMFNE